MVGLPNGRSSAFPLTFCPAGTGGAGTDGGGGISSSPLRLASIDCNADLSDLFGPEITSEKRIESLLKCRGGKAARFLGRFSFLNFATKTPNGSLYTISRERNI